MYSCGPPHMANQKQDDQLEHSYSNYVMIRDVTLKTCRRRWMIGRRGERGSGISVLAARHDAAAADDLQEVQLSGDISSGSSHPRNSTWTTVFTPSFAVVVKYKGETGHPLKVSLEEHRKTVVRGEIEKSGMADHIWKEKRNHLPLWDEVEIIGKAEHWRIRRPKESAHMLGYNDLLSRPSTEMNTI